jgi:CheY-like chemotaxis protein
MTHAARLDPPRSEALRRETRGRPARASSADETPHDRGGRGSHRESGTPAPRRVVPILAGLTVVVVDDDADSLEYFTVALRSRGASVTTASTAIEALRLVREQRPDVVLSDIAMVDQDGYWLVRQIRGLSDVTAPRVPVIATTAYGREHSRERTMAAGFTDHLPKPVDPDVLCRAIASAAGR